MARIPRPGHIGRILDLLSRFPVVALLGARQVGKTTLAREITRQWEGPSHFFDLELPEDVARLVEPYGLLASLDGLVVLDEIQRTPEIFRALRVLADRSRREDLSGESPTARFLVLGSASPSLLRQSSESLAGRLAHHELSGVSLGEVPAGDWETLWRRGGFPRSLTAASDELSYEWRSEFLRTFLERDAVQLGVSVSSGTLRRFWFMLAHYHAQVWNGAELARAFGVSQTAVRRYLDALEGAFMVRTLQPWRANIGKRQVRAPKVYIRDSGMLHRLFGVVGRTELELHPKSGASWEGFVLEQVIRALEVDERDCWFWATHGGAEMDLVIPAPGGRLRGFEIKRTRTPRITPSIRSALGALDLCRVEVIHAGDHTFRLGRPDSRVRAVAAADLRRELA